MHNNLHCMNWNDHISADPNIMFGKLVIKGTRIPVELMLLTAPGMIKL